MTYNDVTYSVTSIGNNAFYECSGLTSVTIPNSVTSIGYGAFQYCSGLTSIDIPNSVTTIGKLAFSHTGLTELTIPHSLTSIGGASFANCDNLRTVHWNAKTCSIYNYSSYSESYYEDYGKMGPPIGSSKSEYSPSPFSIEYYVEIYYENIGQNESYEVVDSDGITDFIFGDEVETISSSLCKWLDDLSYVVIPNSVTSIGDSAFFKCTGLTSVTLNSNTIVSKTYSSSSNISSIFGTQVRNYIIGGNVNAIGYYAFYGCTGLTSVTIGNSVTEIRRSAFYECSGLTSVTIPNSVTHIGEGAFAKCTGLTSVTIPNSVIEIRSYAFQDCSDLTSIYSKIKNPQAVTYGGSRIFYNVPKSTCALYIPKGKYDIYSTTIPWSEFSNIIEMDPTGDVNDDGSVNVTDYVTTASYILEKDPQPFYFEEGDLDENGLITINDLVAVAYQALHYEDNAPSILHNAQCIIKNEECSMGAVVQGNEVIINLSNEIDLTALQMDLALPTGMTLVDASLSGRASAIHQVAFNQLSNGDYRLLASSPACKAFNGNDGTVLTLTLAGEPSGNGVIRNIELATPRVTSFMVDDIELHFETTGVESMKTTTARIYNEGSNIMIDSPTDGTAQIVLPNGMSQAVKVTVGRNVYPAPASGMIILKMSDSIKKLFIK